MKKIYFVLAAVALFISGTNASAQFMNQSSGRSVSSSADVEVLSRAVDFTFSPVTFNAMEDGNSVFTDMKAVSFNYWAPARAISTTHPVYLQYGAGLQYAWQTDKESVGDYSVKSTTSFLTAKVPVNMIYHLDVPNTEIALLPYAGLNLQGHIIGQSKTTIKYDGESESQTLNFFSDDDMDAAFNRLVVGWQIGAKAAINNYFVGIAYEGPVTNLLKDGDWKVNTNQINISIGMKF